MPKILHRWFFNEQSQNVFKSVAQTSSKLFAVILICQKWLDSNPPNYDNHSVVLLLCFYHRTIFLPMVNDFSLGKDVFKSIGQNSSKFLLISLGVQSSWIWTLAQVNYFTTVGKKNAPIVDSFLLTKGRRSKWFQICGK